MTRKRAAGYVAVWLLLTTYYVLFERQPGPGAPEVAPRRGALVDFDGNEVIAVDVESGSRRVRALGAGDRWQVVEPSGAAPPADLIAAFVAALTAADVEIVDADGAKAQEFGLDGPGRRVTLRRRDGSSTTIVLGARNPSQTAIYARREGAPEIVLLGLNVQYYFDLLMGSAAERG